MPSSVCSEANVWCINCLGAVISGFYKIFKYLKESILGTVTAFFSAELVNVPPPHARLGSRHDPPRRLGSRRTPRPILRSLLHSRSLSNSSSSSILTSAVNRFLRESGTIGGVTVNVSLVRNVLATLDGLIVVEFLHFRHSPSTPVATAKFASSNLTSAVNMREAHGVENVFLKCPKCPRTLSNAQADLWADFHTE